jgi:transcriptional regulator with XRE-family HTH domain
MNAKSLASRLRWERLQTGMTQEELAEKSGLSESTISAAETGRRTLRFSTIMKICQGLEIRAETLVEEMEKTGNRSSQEQESNRVLPTAGKAQFEELLKRHLESEENLWRFVFGRLDSRSERTGPHSVSNGKSANRMGARARSGRGPKSR